MFVNFGEDEARFCLKVLKVLRDNGVSAELYPDSVKMKKQMAYANAKHVPFVALVGETEMQENKVTLKNMDSGEQCMVTVDELLQAVR